MCSQQDPHACPMEFWLNRGLEENRSKTPIMCGQARGKACLQNKQTNKNKRWESKSSMWPDLLI